MKLTRSNCAALALLALPLVRPASAQLTASADELGALSRMSLQELANVEVTSVSKSAQALSSSPASIYVITREEILRSGVVSVPEALRLAPNLQVEQINAQEYQIGARGFGGHLEAQNFSNKILILIDGRSVYNPLFSGVSYDAQDVLMEDIDRIEVLSGPGATLWGANAMNGVINIITRAARDTEGASLHAYGGHQESGASGRYGAAFGDDNAYRVYAKAFDRGPTEMENGDSAGDRWHKAMTGFRIDLGPGSDADSFTIQGDYQEATENQLMSDDVGFTQMDVLGRWVRAGEHADTRLQLYVDRTDRDQPPSGVGFTLDTYDLDFQQARTVGGRHRVVWGFGRRYNDYEIVNTPGLAFAPPERRLELTNVFAQDVLPLGAKLSLTMGLKLEENSYSGWSTLPDLRLSWTPNDHSLVWGAAARAIRSPTPFDVDVEERLGGQLFLAGLPDFRTEQVDAYEIGYRSQPSASMSWSVSTFYNDYDDLRSIEPNAVTVLPLHWDNQMHGHTYGVELWANFQVTSWWRLSPGVRTLSKHLRFDDESSELLGVAQAGNDPRYRVSLKSAMVFGRVSLDMMLRHVAKLPSPEAPDYTELDARLAWRVSEPLELALTGASLLHEQHLEYALPTAREIPRSVYVEARWAF
ncbi:MAG TPA: TonB-dependent receptor [Gammaproteobacteria bacterium]|nr:TonB-dependent receptor [Gammaproteobacteria bacterium]